jgi:alpha-1,6-mannosyltransferase
VNEFALMRGLHRRIEFRSLVVAFVAIAMCVGIAGLSRENIASQFLATIIIVLVGLGCVLWISLDRGFDAVTTMSALAILLATRIAALLVEPLLEDDHFRYLWDGYVAATTGQPFLHPPSHFFDDANVPSSMQSALSGINNPDIPTIYGPLLQAFFAFAYGLAPGALWPFKIVLLGAEIAVVLLLRAAGVAPRWLLVYALSPLVLKESAISAHPDVLIGAALLAATLAWARGREVLAALWVCAAISMKFSVVVALPFFLLNRDSRISVRGVITALFALSALLLMSMMSGGGELRALAAFGEHWKFNPLLFRFAALALGDGAARAMVAIAFVAIAGALALRWWLRLRHCVSINDAPLPPIVAVFTTLLLLSPVVNPWYWMWLFPLAMIDRQGIASRIAIAAASMSLLAYSYVGMQVSAQSSITTFAVPWWATLTQIAVISIVALWAMRPRVDRAPSAQHSKARYE